MYVILNPDSSSYWKIELIIQDINNVIDVNEPRFFFPLADSINHPRYQ